MSLLILAPLLFLGLLEGGLRLGGYGYPTGFFVGPDANGTWVTNVRFGWRVFPRSLARNPQRGILPSKSAGLIRIFVLGGSAAMGTPDAAFSFGRILEVMLHERYPGTRFEVVNGAMTAINSHVVREIARDCAAREPDLFVVYMGNNEVIGPYGPGTVFQRWLPGLKMIRASLWVKTTRLGQLIGAGVEALYHGTGAPSRWRGLEMFQDNPVPADDPRLESVYDNYAQNLTDICTIARRARAGVVLSTVAVNLRDFPPLMSRHRSGLAAGDLAKWEAIYKAGIAWDAGSRWPEALGRYDEAAKIDDRFAELQFRMGACLVKAGRFAEARDRFELARDLDALRFRADSRINAIIRDVARKQAPAGVRLVDTERTLAERNPDARGIVGETLFYEHVHLTFDGNYLLARAVLDPVCAALPQLAGVQQQGDILSRQQCAERLAWTAWDEYQMAGKMVDLTSRTPFTHQYNHSLRQAAARHRADSLRRLASTQQAMQVVLRTYTAALAKAPEDLELHHHFGRLAMEWDRPDVAVEHFRFVLEKQPWDPQEHCELAAALTDQGKFDEGIAHYRKALELKPGDAEIQVSLGSALWRGRRVDEAIALYRKALKADPDYAEAHLNLGSALVSRGRIDEGIAHCRKALALKPDDAEAHLKLGSVLVNRGQFDEAIAHYRQALGLKPDDAEAHLNLGSALANRGRIDEAIAHYRQALELNPDYAEAHYNLGFLLTGRGQVDEAIAHFRNAVQLKPDDAEAQKNLGVVLLQKGRTDEAITHFQKALELEPGDAAIRRNLELARSERIKDP